MEEHKDPAEGDEKEDAYVFDLKDAAWYAANSSPFLSHEATMTMGLPFLSLSDSVAIEVTGDGFRLVHLAPPGQVGLLGGEVIDSIPLTAAEAHGFRLAYRLHLQRNLQLSKLAESLFHAIMGG
jgi:hypothetical protein